MKLFLRQGPKAHAHRPERRTDRKRLLLGCMLEFPAVDRQYINVIYKVAAAHAKTVVRLTCKSSPDRKRQSQLIWAATAAVASLSA